MTILKYKLDTVTETKGVFTAYVQVMDGEEIVETHCVPYTDAAQFKKVLAERTEKIKNVYDIVNEKKIEVEQILVEIEAKELAESSELEVTK
jgi:hypothetical protein